MYFVRPWLAIGKYAETVNLPLLQFHGISAMLQLAEAVPQPDIISLYLPVEDGEPIPRELLERGIRFLRDQHAADKVVMSACGAGISRSTTFAMAVLMAEEDLTMFEAYRQILQQHPTAHPHSLLCQSLAHYYGITLSQREIMDQLWQIQNETIPPRQTHQT